MQSRDENATPGPDLACQGVVMESQAIERESNFITPPRRTPRGVGYEPEARAGFEPVNATELHRHYINILK
jgi:hypothetical protein